MSARASIRSAILAPLAGGRSAFARLGARVAVELDAVDRAAVVPGARHADVAVPLCTAALSLLLLSYFGKARFFHAAAPGWSPTGDRQLDGFAFWVGVCVLCYVVLPILALRFFDLGRARDLGLSLSTRHAPLYVAMTLPVVGGVAVVAGAPEFQAVYPFYRLEHGSIGGLLAFELLYALQFVALEFFFRGFLVHVPKRKIGSAAVFVMIVPYCMLHFTKPMPEAAASIGGGLALGLLSLRTGSIAGGCAVHIAIAWSMDALALFHQGRLAAP